MKLSVKPTYALLMGLALAVMLAGCSSYPVNFGLLPGGHIDREHGKPMEGGYYHDFDPAAESLKVISTRGTNPVATQQVVIASVLDEDGNPLVGRRVEWMIPEGSVGAIVEVDESGWYSTRGHKVNNRYAVSHTNHGPHTITRGNDNPDDDIVLEKGQTWCVVTSPVEGTTNLIVYAPAIFNWDKHKVVINKQWLDATWTFPDDAVNPVGTPHDLVVTVAKHSDGTPMKGAIVTYKIVDGPDAVFAKSKTKTTSVETDAGGKAVARLTQVKPKEGKNTIAMSIVRPADECCNPAVKIADGKATKTWVGPRINITKRAPAQKMVGDQFKYDMVVTNPGKAPAANAVVTDVLPDGIGYVSSSPQATVAGKKLTWNLGTLPVGTPKKISVTVKAERTGTFDNCAEVQIAYGHRARACAKTVVTAPSLKVDKTGPSEVLICDTITYSVVVTNNGSGPASNVKVADQLPAGLKTTDGKSAVAVNVGTLGAGKSKKITYAVKADKPGTYTNTVVATAGRGLRAEDKHQVKVTQPKLVITKAAERKQTYVGRDLDYTITVSNKGDGVARGAVLTDALPAGVELVSASNGGQVANGKITWNLGNLAPNATRTVTATIKAVQLGTLTNRADVKAYCSQAKAQVVTQVVGIPAILLEVIDLDDPIEVGERETYVITVTNQGTADDTNIVIACTLPAQQDYISSNGPTQATVAGKKVTFGPLPRLAPKAKAVYRVVVKGNAAGDVRFRVDMNSDELTSGVMETESTRFYE